MPRRPTPPRAHALHPDQIEFLTAVDMVQAEPRRARIVANDFWSLSVLGDGHWETRLGDGPWTARAPGILNLYAPAVRHGQRRRKETKVRFLYACWQAGEPFALRRMVGAHGWASIEDPTGRLAAELAELAKVRHTLGEAGRFRAQAVLYGIVHLLSRLHALDEPGNWRLAGDAAPAPEGGFVEQVRGWMWPRRYGLIRLEDLARALHCSVSSLSHRYREAAGESPLQTQARWRLEEACQLLAQDTPVKTVAGHLGYYDSYHFSKAFKKGMGLSPRAYRRRMTAR